MTPEEIEDKRLAIMADPLDFILLNRSQARFINAIGGSWPEADVSRKIGYDSPPKDSITFVPFLKPNGQGGSYGMIGAWSALMFGSRHPRLNGYPFGSKYPWVKSARILAPVASLADRGPIQKAMRELFPARRWTQSKGTGKSYFCEGRTDTGWTWEAVTSDQPVIQAAGSTHGLLLISEPPPQDIYSESVARLRGCGLILLEMTQLDLADWFEEIEESEGLFVDGRKVGERPRIVWGDLHDACRDCHPETDPFPGHRAHTAIEADIASWPAEEREARRTGKRLRLSGRVYSGYGEHNEISELPDFHAECWEKGEVRIANAIDPHDARPWCVAWFAIFPNSDVIAFAEWPNFDFRSCKSSPVTGIEDYRSLIIESEATIGRPTVMRFMDSGHMYTPGKGNARTLDTMLKGPCQKCLVESGAGLDSDEKSDSYHRANDKCTHKLSYQGWPVYSGSVNYGHTLVRPHLGDPAAARRPKFYVMDSCPNLRYGMKHYAYKVERNPEKKGAEKASFVNKDWPDLVRGGYLANWQDWPAEVKPLAVAPVRTGSPVVPIPQVGESRQRPRTAGVKPLNLNPLRIGGPSNPEPRRS